MWEKNILVEAQEWLRHVFETKMYIQTLQEMEKGTWDFMQSQEARQLAMEEKLYSVIDRTDGMTSFLNFSRGTLHSSPSPTNKAFWFGS